MRNKKNTRCCWCGEYLAAGVGEAFFVDEEDECLGFGPMGTSGWMAKCEDRKACGERRQEQVRKREERKKETEMINASERVLFDEGGEYVSPREFPDGIEYERKGKG